MMCGVSGGGGRGLVRVRGSRRRRRFRGVEADLNPESGPGIVRVLSRSCCPLPESTSAPSRLHHCSLEPTLTHFYVNTGICTDTRLVVVPPCPVHTSRSQFSYFGWISYPSFVVHCLSFVLRVQALSLPSLPFCLIYTFLCPDGGVFGEV